MKNEVQMGGQGLECPVEVLAAMAPEVAPSFHRQGEGSRGLDLGSFRDAW